LAENKRLKELKAEYQKVCEKLEKLNDRAFYLEKEILREVFAEKKTDTQN